jgi:DNA polymerase-3 subunit delta'
VPFSHILGQPTAVAMLSAALHRRRAHHAYRFEGPEGVGKELIAFSLARALVCTGGDLLGCERCEACRRATTMSSTRPRTPLHPDVCLVERGLYPAETIGRTREELTEISVDQIRTIVLAHAAYPPHEGRARVFIVRRADELSASAANALLKTLEEPRQGTHFVLLTSRGDRLLSTIRSRTLPVRFGPLPDDVVRSILRDRGVPDERQGLALELASGSASQALELVDDDRTRRRDAFVTAVDNAVGAQDLGAAISLSESRETDKNLLRDGLSALAATLARRARDEIQTNTDRALTAARRYAKVANAQNQLDRNASPGLVLIELVQEMRACG